MTIRVIGPTSVDGGTMSPRDRSVLAALAVRPGLPLSLDELAEACWQDAPPGTRDKQLQASVSRLRRLLGTRAIATVPRGYLLSETVPIDVAQLESELAGAALHRSAGEPDRAVEAFRRAFALWRGPPFADLPDWPPARIEAARLVELVRTAEEDLQLAHLECGEHRSVLAAAEQLVHQAPLRETRWALLALAAYRSGRQAEALGALRTARQMLLDELGIDPGPELTALEAAILRQDPALLPEPVPPRASDECPFRGLSPFDVADAESFHGRDALTQTATSRLLRGGFLALAGASGCGKSSLALAGVAAALRGRGWTVDVIRPTMTASMLSAATTTAHGNAQSSRRRLLVVDQLEEIFQLLPAAREALCVWVCDSLDAGSAVLVTVRSDYLDRVAALPGIGRHIAHDVLVVRPMSRDELREAVEAPAEDAGLRLEAGLTELLLSEAGSSPDALPLVSHALVETWARREGGVMTVAGYESSGGIAGAIGRSADHLYDELDPEGRRLCRDIMLRLVERGLHGRPVRRRLSVDDITDDPAREQVVTLLTRARLVSIDGDALVITHEAVADAWPQLRDWLEQDADDSRTIQQVSRAARAWGEAGERGEDLLRGTRLAAAVEWEQRAGPALTPLEARFLAASVAAEHEESAAASERVRRDRRQNRTLRAALVVGAALLVLSIVTTGAAVAHGRSSARSAHAAAAAQRDASIEALLSTSLNLRASERDLSALLAAAMWRNWPGDVRSRVALMGVVTASGGAVSTTYVGADRIVGVGIPGTSSALTVEDSRTVAVRDAVTGTIARTTDVAGDDILGLVAVSRDGRAAAIVTHSGLAPGRYALLVLDVASLAPTAPPVDLSDRPASLALSNDGHRAAVVGPADDAITVIDVARGTTRTSEPLLPMDERPEITPPAALVFTVDDLLAVGTPHDELVVLEPATATTIRRLTIPPRAASTALVALDDGVVIGSGEHSILAIDVRSGALLWTRALEAAKPTACLHLAASLESGTLYCGGQFGRTTEFRIADGLPTGRPLDPQLGAESGLSVSDDGKTLLVVGADTPTLSVSRIDGGGAAARIVARGHVAFDGFGLDGTRLVVAERPPDAVYDFDMTAFSIWDPARDEAAVSIAGTTLGAGWFGDDLVTGGHPDGTFVFVRASDGAQVAGGPVPSTSRRTWPSASGLHSYVAMSDGVLRAYDGTTGRPLPVEHAFGSTAAILNVATNDDDSLVAVTRWVDGAARTGVYAGDTLDVVVDGLVGPTTTAFGDDELFAAEAGRITRHDLTTLDEIGTLPGARGEVNVLQLDDRHTTLLAGANDDTVTLYDVASGRRLGDPVPANAPFIGLGFLRPDGLEFAVNVAEGIQLWDLRPARQYEAACRLAGREPTAQEWSTYLAWLGPQSPLCPRETE